jgi:hypothetical protein
MLNIRNITLNDNYNWDSIIEKSDTTSFFQTKEWLQLWVKHFGGDILILGLFDDTKFIGIAPFRKTDKGLSLLGTDSVLDREFVTDFGDIIAIQGREKEIWTVVIKEIINRKSELGKAEFQFIREDSQSFHILQSIIRNGTESDIAPYIDLPKNWDEYLSSLDRHSRHEIKRKIRRLEEEKAFKICKDGDPSDIEEFFRLMSLSSDKKEGFLTMKMKDFFSDIINTFKIKKQLNLCFMKLYGINIASTLSFIYKNSVYLYNSGFDPSYNRLSPGLTLKAYLIKQAIEEGKSKFEFLRGSEKYKYDLGGKERKLYKFTTN